jgi:hypothetical protein
MTAPTERSLARMEVDIVRWQQGQMSAEEVAAIMETDLPALVAALREARAALEPFAAFYSALIAHEERGIYPPPDDREIARFLGEGGPLSLTVGDVRRIARIVEFGSAGLPQHEPADESAT